MAYTRKSVRWAAGRAAMVGAKARKAGEPVTACPYDPGVSKVQEFLARYWVKGWNRGRRAGLGT